MISDGERWIWATRYQLLGGTAATNHQLSIPLENRIGTATSNAPSAAGEVTQASFPTAYPAPISEDQLSTTALGYGRGLSLKIPQDLATLQATFKYLDGLTSASSATTSEFPFVGLPTNYDSIVSSRNRRRFIVIIVIIVKIGSFQASDREA
jgi:hypothetical protein